jgi:hypothetical protein
MADHSSGQAPFRFAHRPDLSALPDRPSRSAVELHGTFAEDRRGGCGQLYYGMPGCGVMRVSADLTTHETIPLPAGLRDTNFHSTRLGQFDGEMRLIMPANNDAMVAVLSLEGDLQFVLPRPEFEGYTDAEKPYRPTDAVLVGERLFVADGYGSNYINVASLESRRWISTFGGAAAGSDDHSGFGTAHGLAQDPLLEQLTIADRLHSRFEIYTTAGSFVRSFALPPGSRPCGIDFSGTGSECHAVVGSLDDPQEGRPAPIYILDAATYQVVSTVRPKEDLGIELADHLHNVVWHRHGGRTFLVCQSWNPGSYFVLEQVVN